MGRFSWLRLYRRHLLASAANDKDFFARVSELRPQALHRFGFLSGRSVEYATARLPLGIRYIHATGFSSSAERNYYEILGVPENASRDEIKKAFHSLAKKYHPDANRNNPSAKRKFQEIREAYETLQDPEKRAQYDRKRTQGSENVEYAGGGADGFRYAYRTHFSDSFHKIFSEIFEHETDHFASDIQVELSLSFSEAAKGCTKNLSFDAFVPCDFCHGRGYPLDAKTKVCPTCGGIGRVTIPPFTSTCGTCKGSGQYIKEYCMSCKGSGVVEGVKEVKVTIPAGVDAGDTIRVPGAGSGGRGSQAGSLFIKIKAILGGTVDVQTLSGKVQVKIPKGVQPGQLLVLRGKGLPKHGFLVSHGDHYVRFRVNFPTVLNERQRAILEEFAQEEINHANSNSIEGNWLYQQLSTG
ncbi:hypothetical protein I3760_07G167200 [Carya illinoinensis]|uniref:Chaperone protein dnaJ 1, mitochondrial n=1 Tax=Carya illinoinensis TaxID=32201 RepID=A0A922ENJ4_CARIL|nr:hypothetical protein I3760_07G167200 [Carya illinoinensis]KAG6705266.1 hypothetical protein I3842_07G172200 [Carya illinoinensis]KAG6705269.1 hypothetical protein I3842_07G172200 [Carya illinoinensis]